MAAGPDLMSLWNRGIISGHTMRRMLAAADIGSNTAHLLVGDVSARSIKRVINDSVWLSLGEVVTRCGSIPDHSADQLMEVLRGFRRMAEGAKADSLYVFATEAMRRASNCVELLERAEREAGVKIDLIPPAREAELGLRGALMDAKPLSPHVLVEVGGGSAQVAWCRGHEVQKDASLKLGTGVLIASANLSYPARASQVDQMRLLIHESLEEGLAGYSAPRGLTGCGGVIRGIWRALHPEGDRLIHLNEIGYLVWSTARLTPEQISARYGVKAKRAVTLLPGALVFEALMERFGLEECEVSQFGVREGALLEMAGRGGLA